MVGLGTCKTFVKVIGLDTCRTFIKLMGLDTCRTFIKVMLVLISTVWRADKYCTICESTHTKQSVFNSCK